MNSILLGNVISLAAAAVMLSIGLVKNKDNIIKLQCAQFGLYAAANAVLGGYTGVAANVVSIIRNLICLKREFTLPYKIVFIVIQLILAILINNAGALGWLPIIAALLFTYFLDLKDPVKFKYVIIIGQALWVVYDYCMCNYVSCTFDALTIVTNIIGILRIKQSV